MNNKYLTEESINIFKQFPENYEYENKNELKVIEVENAIVHNFIKPDYGCVTDENFNIIEESCTYWVHNPERTDKQLIAGKVYEQKYYNEIDEEVVFVGLFYNHWGHFLSESTSRLWFLLDEKNKNRKVCYIEMQGADEFLYLYKWFGLKEDQLIKVDKNTKFKKVIIPENSYTHVTTFHNKFKDIMQKIGEQFEPLEYKKVYISRTKFKHHLYGSITHGEDVIEKIFQDNGYYVVHPEDVGDEYMIRLMKGADIVAAVYGSNMINIFFAKNNTKLYILYRSLSRIPSRLFIESSKCDVTDIDAYLISMSNDSILGENGQPYLLGITEELKKFFDDNKFKYDIKEASKNILSNLNDYIKSFIDVNSKRFKDQHFFIVRNDIKNSINRFKVYEDNDPTIKSYFDLIRKMVYPLIDESKNIEYQKLVDTISWWIPIKKWRQNFKNRFK